MTRGDIRRPERIRVLRVMARLNVGGPALQATVLSNRLDPDLFEQRLLAGTVGDDEADYVSLRAPELRVERVAGLGRTPSVGGDVTALADLVRVVRRFRPHIVHTHTAKAGVLGRLAAWTGRAPATVHTYHGHLLHGYFSPAKTRVVVGMERSFARPTTRLVAVGNRVRDDLLAARIGRPEQYVVVPPGVDLPPRPSRSEARRALGVPVDAPVVGFVARLTGVKRPDRFAAVARAVAASHPNTVFVVAGEGELLPELERQVAPLGDRVRFLGWRSDVEVIHAACDVALLTSDNEGMPVSLIEAAVCGIPAVTTRVGSASEVVIDGVTGLVTELDVDALAAGVRLLLDDRELRHRMGEAAARRGDAEYSGRRLASDVAELYESISLERRLERSK